MLRLLSFNVHVGTAIPALAWLLAHLPVVHIVAVQEASRPRARRALFVLFPSRYWHRFGPDVDDAPLVGTYVFARRRRFRRLAETSQRISQSQPKVDGKDMFPRRDLVGGILEDKRTGRTVDVTSAHTWHMVGRRLGDSGVIARGHTEQVRAYASHHRSSARTRPGSLQVSGGDWNEDVDGSTPRGEERLRVRRIMRDAGLRPAGDLTARGDRAAHLDEWFVRPEKWLRVQSRRVIRVPFRAADHPAVAITVWMDPKPNA